MATLTLEREECNEGSLPPVCIRCGEPTSGFHKQTFYWIPPVTYLAIFICLPVYIILLFVLRKQMTVFLPICETHRRMWTQRLLLSLVGGAFILCGILGAALTPDLERETGFRGTGAVILIVGLLMAGALFFIANLGMIRPSRITNNDITLKGFSPIFVDTIEQYRILLGEDEL